MSTDPHNRIPALQLEPPADPPERTAEDDLRELRAAHNMQQNLMALELRGMHETQIKQGRSQEKHHERSRSLLIELRDAMRDLAKPDATQDAILVALRALHETNKDIAGYLAALVDMNSNGSGTSH